MEQFAWCIRLERELKDPRKRLTALCIKNGSRIHMLKHKVIQTSTLIFRYGSNIAYNIQLATELQQIISTLKTKLGNIMSCSRQYILTGTVILKTSRISII